MAISKVKSVQGKGHFDGKFGRMFKFDYEFEDGTSMEANHKTTDGFFDVGKEVEYTVTRTHETYGKSGKVGLPQDENGGYQSSDSSPNDKPAPQGNRGSAPPAGNSDKFKKDVEGSKAIEALKMPAFALSYAKDLVVPVASQYTDGKRMAADVVEMAEIFLTFLKSKS